MNDNHSKKTQRSGEGSVPTRPSHLKRTSSANKDDADERHYYLYVPSLKEYKKTRWTETGIVNLKRDLAVAQETISEFRDLIADLEAPKPREELKKSLIDDRAEKKTRSVAMLEDNDTRGRSSQLSGSQGGSKSKRLNKREREKMEKIEKLKKEQEEMLKDLDDIFEGGH